MNLIYAIATILYSALRPRRRPQAGRSWDPPGSDC